MRKKLLIAFILSFVACLLAIFSSCTLFGKKPKTEKTQITADMVRGISPTSQYVYSGEPIVFPERTFEIYLDGRYVSIEYFEFEYKDNLNVGTATVIVKTTSDNPVLKGETEVHFTIIANSGAKFDGGTLEELNAKLSDPNILAVTVWSPLRIEEGEKLLIPEGKKLNLTQGNPLYVYGEVENYGRIAVASATMYNGEKRETQIYNKGGIVNHGEMELKSGAFLNSFGTFESDSEIPLGGKAYVNDEKPSFFKEYDGGVVYVRARVSSENVTISEEKRTCKAQWFDYRPEVRLGTEKSYNFTVEYHNNTHAGEANVTVTAHEDSCLFYGTATIPFEIYRGTVSVSSLAELKTYSESGDFNRYECAKLTIGEGETFTLKAEETLAVSEKLTVNGTLKNAGTVRAYEFDSGANSKIENTGSVSVLHSNAVVSGEFENAAEGDVSFETNASFGATSVCVNAGRIVSQGYLSFSGSFKNLNGGFVESGASYFQYGSVENAGTMNLDDYAHFAATATLENSGMLNVKKNSLFNDMNVVNTGKIVNGGGLVCLKLTRFENVSDGFDNENGSVWTFDPLSFVTKNVIIRKALTDESVIVSPEYSEAVYDGNRKEPTFTVNGETIPQEEYSRSGIYIDRNDSPTLFNKAGTVEVTIRIKTDYSKYAGEYKFTYVIKRASIEVSSKYELSKALSEDGYEKIYLTNDINYYSSNGRLLSTATLYLNGHSIVFDGSFDNFGTIVSDEALPLGYVPTKDTAAITITARTSFRNFGLIENANLLFAEGGSNFLANVSRSSTEAPGSIVNNGLIYANNAVTATGTGETFMRIPISVADSYFTIAEARYTGAALRPDVVCDFGGSPIDGSRFELIFSDNVNAGTASVEVNVASDFDETFYGKTNLTFTILRAEFRVADSAMLRTAAQNANYEKIILDAPIHVIENITLSDEQTLDLGSYELTFADRCILTMGENCRLILEADSKDRFIKYVYGADEITLTADISQAVEMNFNAFDLAEIAGENNNSTVVHMNGHSLSAGITIINAKMTNFSIEFENSSDSPSAVGTEVGGYAFEVGTCSKATNVTLRNLTVYGFENSASGTDVLHISADNCSFRGSIEAENQFALRIWSQSEYVSGTFNNCVFSGASGIYLNAGCVYDHDSGTTLPSYFFDHCSISAYGDYVDSYREHYGNALVMERINRRVAVKITESSLFSQKGNGIRMAGTVGLYLNLDSKTTIQYGSGKSDILWDSTT